MDPKWLNSNKISDFELQYFVSHYKKLMLTWMSTIKQRVTEFTYRRETFQFSVLPQKPFKFKTEIIFRVCIAVNKNKIPSLFCIEVELNS